MALITLFGGAAISLLSSAAQRRWTRRDAKDQREAERQDRMDAARRDRVIKACEEILVQQALARSLISAHNDLSTIPEQLSDVSEQIDRLSVFIPDDDLRERVENLASFIWWSDCMNADLNVQPGVIAWTAANEIGTIAGCIIRRQDCAIPDWYDSWVLAFKKAEREHEERARARTTTVAGSSPIYF